MAEKIQSVPATLLDLLGIKSLGRNPVALADEVRGSIDLTDFYLASRLEIVRVQNLAIAVAGDDANVTVDNGEIWIVKEISATVKQPSAAGAIMNGAIQWRHNAAAASGALALCQTPRAVATTNALEEKTTCAVVYDEPRLFLPGNVIEAELVEAVGGALTVRIELRVALFRMAF